jgi:hypothetical protein
VISKNIVVTNRVKFRSLLLIFKQITSVFAIIINLFIWHFYFLPYYNIQFTIGRYSSKIHMHICFEENGTKVCFYKEESCHKINTFCVYFTTPLSLLYMSDWFKSAVVLELYYGQNKLSSVTMFYSSCSLAVLWPEQVIFGDDVLY